MTPADLALTEWLGGRLREIRDGIKPAVTQAVVGERAGFTAKYISEIERGERDVPLSTLRAVIEALGTTFEYVFADRGKAPTKLAYTPPMPRDVELTAELLAELPLYVRRPLLQTIKAVSQGERANDGRSPRRKRK